MKQQHQLSLLWIVGALLFGCGQNPYPKEGKLLSSEPEKPVAIPPPFVLDIPLQVDLEEGTMAEIPVHASVPKPGTPIVTFKDLPEGAAFDSNSMKLTWNPSFEAGNDNDPHLASRSYQVSAALSSSADTVTTVQRLVNLVVHDSPRAFKITVEKEQITQNEGETVTIPLRITSEDFPEGAFRVLGLQMPSGAEIKKTNEPTLFQLVYPSNFLGATINDSSSSGKYYKRMKANVAAELPSGRMASLDVNWDLMDVRQNPVVSAPTALAAGLDANFTLSASDPNGEVQPKVSFDKPSFGNFKVSDLTPFDRNNRITKTMTLKAIRWTDIPSDQIGKTTHLKYEVCVKRNYYSLDRCTQHAIDISFNPDQYPAPTIDRTRWPLGMIRYVKEGTSQGVEIPVQDASSSQTKVEISPPEMGKEVAWSNGILKVTPKKPGIRQFNLHVTSAYGAKNQESFLLEVLPSSWSEVLVLGESHKVTELVKTGALFENAQYANPTLQSLDQKLLALRKMLVVTTSAMKDPVALKEIEGAAAQIHHLVILSPLADQFTGSILTELTGLKVGFTGRFLAQTGLPALGLFSLIAEPDGGLKAPVFPIHLEGTTSDESKSPLILNPAASSPCTKLLTLRKEDLPQVFPMTLSCPRKQKGKLILSGFEWADAVPAPSDEKILKEWMTKLVNP